VKYLFLKKLRKVQNKYNAIGCSYPMILLFNYWFLLRLNKKVNINTLFFDNLQNDFYYSINNLNTTNEKKKMLKWCTCTVKKVIH